MRFQNVTVVVWGDNGYSVILRVIGIECNFNTSLSVTCTSLIKIQNVDIKAFKQCFKKRCSR